MTILAQGSFSIKRANRDGYSCSLTSYSTMLNSDSNGVIGSLAAAVTTVKLYQGSTAVTPVISINSASNCSAGISGLNVSIVSVPNNTKSGYVDIKIVYGGFVKIERYTFTVVDYTVVKNYTQTIVGDQMTSYATKATVDALGKTVSGQSTTIQQNSKDIALKASQSDVTALGNRMKSAEAKITPDAINLTVKSQTEDIASNAAKRTSITVDASSLDVNTYYPILIGMNSTVPYTITVERTLDKSMGVPSYSTHESGFSVFCKWTSNGSGWGTIDIKRVIHLFQYRYTANNIPPIGSIGQMTNHSLEFIYVRGGSKYNVLVEGASDVNIQLITSTYTTDYPTYTQTINLLTSIEAPTPDIDLRPTTDEIKASFTIDTGGISMLGKKISLVGIVTFSSLALDAQNKINTAQSTADSANSAAGKAQTTADSKASTAYVDNAKGAAISAAASDATSKAGQAKTDAISAAASDASNKASGALASAKSYTDGLKGSLGALAWEKAVGLAKLDNTIIDGGFIKTNLIDAVKIVTQGLSAQTIDAGNATIKNLNVDTVKMTNADVSGKITAASGAIGLFSIDNNGLYFGDPTKWRTSAYKQDLASIVPGCIKIQKQIGYFQPGDIANIKVGIGDGADPSVNPTGSSFCTSAGYFYRQMNSSTDPYFPAVRIISDNVVNRNIALETIGGIRAKNGMIDMGRLMRVNDMNAVNVIDLSFGTSIVISNSMNNFSFFLPTLSQVRAQLGITSSDSFCIPLRIGIDKNSYYGIYLKTQNKANPPASDAEGGMLVDNDGREWQSSNLTMAKGDVARFSLTYTPYSGYYAQLDTWFN